jgi:hypothetical protein
MRPTTNHLSITAVRTAALFASAVQRSDEPSDREIQQAVAAAVRRFGSRGCAGLVAQEFGEHPEIAAPRMRWARQVVGETFPGPRLRLVSRPCSVPHLAGRAGRAA